MDEHGTPWPAVVCPLRLCLFLIKRIHAERFARTNLSTVTGWRDTERKSYTETYRGYTAGRPTVFTFLERDSAVARTGQ